MTRRERGFTYVVVMFAVAVAAVAATRAMEGTAVFERQTREAELLYIGGLYRDAIVSYHDNSPGTLRTYPKKLEDLLEDDRTSTLRRHLRKIYRDPVTGDSNWGLVMTADDRVMGVYSLSAKRPQKQGGFGGDNASFKDAQSYQDWKFIHAQH